MQLIEMKALRPVTGNYGRKQPGDRFWTDDKTALRLASRGTAEYYFPPAPAFLAPRAPEPVLVEERKVIVPMREEPREHARFDRRRGRRR